MRSFDYISVQSAEEALAAKSEYGSESAVIAGGTDLLVELRRPAAVPPRLLIDVGNVREFHGIHRSGNAVTVGPLVTHDELMRAAIIRHAAPLLASAASTIGSPQIRNRGTVGGNVMNAAPCADAVPPLIALDAIVSLRSAGGSREMSLADLFLKPYRTKAAAGELLTGIRFEALPSGSRSSFLKLGRRNAVSISRLSVAAVMQLDDQGRITDARIAPGSVFPTWRRIASAERILMGEKPSVRVFEAAGREVAAEMIRQTGRRWSTEYKEPVVAALVRRALEACSADSPLLTETSQRKDGSDTMRRPPVLSAGGLCAIETTINGRNVSMTVPADRLLLDFLRDDLGLPGTKCGCGIGECGACTVVVDGRAVNSCLLLAAQVHGKHVLTIEGLRQNGELHPLQSSYIRHDAVHCGFCTPGMIMSSKALLDENSHPTEPEIRTAISGNLCRCTGYVQIVEAVKGVAENV